MRKRNKMSMSVSFDNEMIDRIDEHVTNHHIPSFSAFIREAVSYYLDHNQNVTEVSINDSKLIESIKDIPEDTEPPPTDNTPVVNKSAFNFDDINLGK